MQSREVVRTTLSNRILVSMATYNEALNVEKLIAEIHEQLPDAEILVVDDNSPDGTGKLIDRLGATDPRIHALHRPRKMGLGTAILAAMRYAIAHDFDYMFNIDADFSHPPRYIPAMIEGMKKKDIMIGSRYVPGGGATDWPLSRRMMSAGVNGLVRLMLRLPAHDCSGGYRCYRVAKLRETNFEGLRSVGYSFQQEILYRCVMAGSKVGETPIIFENRKHGKSKVNIRESIRSLTTLVVLGVRFMLGLDRGRFRQLVGSERNH
jgi:dolichol-phosphate mannosyltransferase